VAGGPEGVFTAGVGENSARVRERAVDRLGFLGIAIDPALNAAPSGEARVVSPAESAIPVLVVPTDEELQIARETVDVLRG